MNFMKTGIDTTAVYKPTGMMQAMKYSENLKLTERENAEARQKCMHIENAVQKKTSRACDRFDSLAKLDLSDPARSPVMP